MQFVLTVSSSDLLSSTKAFPVGRANDVSDLQLQIQLSCAHKIGTRTVLFSGGKADTGEILENEAAEY